MKPWTFIEPCCGSAAISLRLLGYEPVAPYQGTKDPYEIEIRDIIGRMLGLFHGAPSRILLSDASPWALAVATLLREPERVLVTVTELVKQGAPDARRPKAPEVLYERLSGALVPTDPVQLAAELFWLQRMSFSGRAVGERGGRWLTAGLNTTSAYGLPATGSFGAVHPQGNTLRRAVMRVHRHSDVSGFVGLLTTELCCDLPIWDGPVVVLLDPPYQGTQGYPSGTLDRTEVVHTALRFANAGAFVIFCEAEPIDELVERGWEAIKLAEPRKRMQGDKHREEWVTVFFGGRR